MKQKQLDELATFLVFSDYASDPRHFVYDEEGCSPEEAFYEVTARGNQVVFTVDPILAGKYIHGQKLFNLTFDMWATDIRDGLLDKNELLSYYSVNERVYRYVSKRLQTIS